MLLGRRMTDSGCGLQKYAFLSPYVSLYAARKRPHYRVMTDLTATVTPVMPLFNRVGAASYAGDSGVARIWRGGHKTKIEQFKGETQKYYETERAAM